MSKRRKELTISSFKKLRGTKSAAQEGSLSSLSKAVVGVANSLKEGETSAVEGGQERNGRFLDTECPVVLLAKVASDGTLIVEAFTTTQPATQILSQGLFLLSTANASLSETEDTRVEDSAPGDRLKNAMRLHVVTRKKSGFNGSRATRTQLPAESKGDGLTLKSPILIDGRVFEVLPLELFFRALPLSVGHGASHLNFEFFDPGLEGPLPTLDRKDKQRLRGSGENHLRLPRQQEEERHLRERLATLQSASNDMRLLEVLNDFALLRLLKKRLRPCEAFTTVCNFLKIYRRTNTVSEARSPEMRSRALPGPVFRLLKIFVDSHLAEGRPLL